MSKDKEEISLFSNRPINKFEELNEKGSDIGFANELAISQHIGKIHNSKLVRQFISEDYVLAKLDASEREYAVNCAVSANQATKLINKIIRRFKDLPYTIKYKKEMLDKLKDTYNIDQDIMLESDVISNLKRNVPNNHILSHMKGKGDVSNELGMENLPEEMQERVIKMNGDNKKGE